MCLSHIVNYINALFFNFETKTQQLHIHLIVPHTVGRDNAININKNTSLKFHTNPACLYLNIAIKIGLKIAKKEY